MAFIPCLCSECAHKIKVYMYGVLNEQLYGVWLVCLHVMVVDKCRTGRLVDGGGWVVPFANLFT